MILQGLFRKANSFLVMALPLLLILGCLWASCPCVIDYLGSFHMASSEDCFSLFYDKTGFHA